VSCNYNLRVTSLLNKCYNLNYAAAAAPNLELAITAAGSEKQHVVSVLYIKSVYCVVIIDFYCYYYIDFYYY
jgi:hypothetical protein